MADPRFKAVAIDLFNTLVKWDPAGLPNYNLRGRSINGTIPLVLPHLREHFDPLGSRRCVSRACTSP